MEAHLAVLQGMDKKTCPHYQPRLDILGCLEAELKKGKSTHVRYRFSFEKARRKPLPCVTDRVPGRHALPFRLGGRK